MHLRKRQPPTIEQIKRELRQCNVKVHPDMTGPTMLIEGLAVQARSTIADAVVNIVLRDKKTNFAFYQASGDIIRYAAW